MSKTNIALEDVLPWCVAGKEGGRILTLNVCMHAASRDIGVSGLPKTVCIPA